MLKFQKSKTERRSKSHKRETPSKIKISENYDALIRARQIAQKKDEEIRRSKSMDKSKELQETPTFADKVKSQ